MPYDSFKFHYKVAYETGTVHQSDIQEQGC